MPSVTVTVLTVPMITVTWKRCHSPNMLGARQLKHNEYAFLGFQGLGACTQQLAANLNGLQLQPYIRLHAVWAIYKL